MSRFTGEIVVERRQSGRRAQAERTGERVQRVGENADRGGDGENQPAAAEGGAETDTEAAEHRSQEGHIDALGREPGDGDVGQVGGAANRCVTSPARLTGWARIRSRYPLSSSPATAREPVNAP